MEHIVMKKIKKKKINFTKHKRTKDSPKKKTKKILYKYGIRNENTFFNALTSNNDQKIIEWTCNNIDIVYSQFSHDTPEGKYIIYKVGRINQLNNYEKSDYKFIVRGYKNFGKGSWGSVYEAYVLDSNVYKNKIYKKKALDNKKAKLKGFINKKITSYSTAFNLLIKHDIHFFRLILKKCVNKFAIKIPNSMDTDGESIKDILYEPCIQGIIGSNETVKNYVPKLNHIFIQPKIKKWKSKCKNEDELPDSIIVSIMEKLDGTFKNILKEKCNKQLNEKKSHRIQTDLILSYLLQISIGLLDLYKYTRFNHRDLKDDNTMYIYNKEKIKSKMNINLNIFIDGMKQNIKFNFPTYGYEHKIIDFGLSCIEYKEYKLNTVTYYDKEDQCFSQSRDLSQLVFSLLNYYWNIMDDKLIGYLGHLLKINDECNLWRNLLSNDESDSDSDSDSDNSDYINDSLSSIHEGCPKCGTLKYISKGITSTELDYDPIIDSKGIKHFHDELNKYTEKRQCVACNNIYTIEILPECSISDCDWQRTDENLSEDSDENFSEDSDKSYISTQTNSNNSLNNVNTFNFNTSCREIQSWEDRLYDLLNHSEFDNKKTYPEKIIYDIYNYSLTGDLPTSDESIEIFKQYRKNENL